MIEVGTLNKRVRFDRFMEAPDSHGDVQDPETGAVHKSWVPVITVWAAIRPLSAREFRASASEQGEWTCNITTRYNRLLADSTDMRAVHLVDGQPGTIFNIAGPLADRDSGYEYFTFPAKAGVTDGE